MFARDRRELKYNLMLCKEALQKKNMNIKMEEMKIMILGGEESEVEGIKMERVKSFQYLGTQMQNNWKQEAETNERISTTMEMYYAFNRNFLRVRTITKKTK